MNIAQAQWGLRHPTACRYRELAEDWGEELTHATDTETRGAVSSLFSSIGSTLRGRVAGSHSPINSITGIVVEFDNLKDAEH